MGANRDTLKQKLRAKYAAADRAQAEWKRVDEPMLHLRLLPNAHIYARAVAVTAAIIREGWPEEARDLWEMAVRISIGKGAA